MKHFGIYRGVVTGVNDPSNLGRLRVSVPRLFGAGSVWAFPALTHPGAAPPVATLNQGVWVQFEGGDLQYPVYTGFFGGRPERAKEKPVEVDFPGLVARVDALESTVAALSETKAVEMKGGNISAWQTDPVAGIAKILDDIDRLGLNAVTLPIRVSTPDVSSNSATVDSASLAYAQLVRDALPKHVRVIVEAYPWINDGNQSETLWEPTDLPTWFANWEAACVTIARAFPLEYAMYISSNMPYMQPHWNLWKPLIQAVRSNLTRDVKIAFRTNWWFSAPWDPGSTAAFENMIANPLWEYVDVIAISGYFELNGSDDPGWEEMSSDLHSSSLWERSQPIYDQIERFTSMWGKPWWFGELAVSHWTNGASQPWNPDSGSVAGGQAISRMIQYNYFKAYWETFVGNSSNYTGFSIFNIGHPWSDSGYVLQRAAVRYIKSLPTT